MAPARKKSTAKKTTARKSTARATTASSKTTARKTPAKAPEVVTTTAPDLQAGGIVRVEAGGIDPRLVEARDAQRQAEAGIRPAGTTEATIDPKLIEIRDRTKARELELANRSLTKPPTRG